MPLQNALGNIALDSTLTGGSQKTQLVDGAGDVVAISASGEVAAADATLRAVAAAVTDVTTGFERMKVGNVSFRDGTSFQGASMPQDGWSVVSTGTGMTVSLAGAANGARYLNIDTGTTTSQETVVQYGTLVTLPLRISIQVSLSQRIANQEFDFELAGVDANGNVESDGTGPLNWVALRFNGTTATNALLLTRSNGGSVALGTAATTGTTAATGTTPNFIPATTYDLLFQSERITCTGAPVNSVTAAGGTIAQTIALPSLTKQYRIRWRVRNLGSAPASTTAARLHQVRITDLAQLSTEITSVRSPSDPQGALPVNLTGLLAATAGADNVTNPTLGGLLGYQMLYNGSAWDRVRPGCLTQNVDTSSARTATGTGAAFTNWGPYRNLIVWINVTAVSGTTPTCVFKLQWSPDNGTTYLDMDTTNLQTTSITGVTTATLRVGQNVTTAANSSKADLVPRLVRLAWTIGGTSPSFTFATWYTAVS